MIALEWKVIITLSDNVIGVRGGKNLLGYTNHALGAKEGRNILCLVGSCSYREPWRNSNLVLLFQTNF